MSQYNSLVSIIMPTYNSEKTVIDSINSVLQQTYKNWELIIVDDNSIDRTWELIVGYSELYSNIHVFKNDVNKGAGASRNLAIEQSKGRFIAFLDSDDLWLKEKLSEQIPFMLRNGYALTYSYYSCFNSEKDTKVITAPVYTTYKNLMYSNVIGCLTAVYDTDLLGKRFMPLIRKRQDMGLWLDILKDIPKAYCIPQVLAKYRIDTGMTSNKFTVLSYQWRFYRDVVGLGLFKSMLTFSIYAVKGLVKYIN